MYSCVRNESSPAAVRWTANGVPLYTFGIPGDLGTSRAIQSAGFVGLIGSLVNETLFTLTVDLTTSIDIVNGTGVACGELITGVNSDTMNLFIIGKNNNQFSDSKFTPIVDINIQCTLDVIIILSQFVLWIFILLYRVSFNSISNISWSRRFHWSTSECHYP